MRTRSRITRSSVAAAVAAGTIAGGATAAQALWTTGNNCIASVTPDAGPSFANGGVTAQGMGSCSDLKNPVVVVAIFVRPHGTTDWGAARAAGASHATNPKISVSYACKSGTWDYEARTITFRANANVGAEVISGVTTYSYK